MFGICLEELFPNYLKLSCKYLEDLEALAFATTLGLLAWNNLFRDTGGKLIPVFSGLNFGQGMGDFVVISSNSHLFEVERISYC